MGNSSKICLINISTRECWDENTNTCLKCLQKYSNWNSMRLSKIFQIVNVRFTSAGAVGCDEEEECCDGDDENESKKNNYHGKRRPSGMLNLTYRERESLKYVFRVFM